MADRELRTLRERQAARGRELDRLDGGRNVAGSPYELLEVVAVVAVPTAVEKYFAVKSVAIDGAEGENAVATFTASGDVFYVAVAGTPIPVAGSHLIGNDISGRWASGGGSGAPHCTVSVKIFRDNTCPAVGAHVTLKHAGVTIATGDTDITGVVNFGTASPGTTYTIEWSYFSLSGSFTAGCGFSVISIANPPDSGLFPNCRDAPPPVLYVTDVAGTRQVWPVSECVQYTPPLGLMQSYITGLSPLGTCFSPSWRLGTSVYLNPAACTGTQLLFDGTNTFSMPCTRPYSFSGTYPTPVPGQPFHPFHDTPFVFHE